MCCNSCHSCSCGNTAIFPFYLPVIQANLTEFYENAQAFQADSSRSSEEFSGGCGCNTGCGCNCNNSGCGCSNGCNCGNFCCG